MTTIADLATVLKANDYDELLEIAKHAPLLALVMQKDPLLVLEALDMVSVGQAEQRLRSLLLSNGEEADSSDSTQHPFHPGKERRKPQRRIEDLF